MTLLGHQDRCHILFVINLFLLGSAQKNSSKDQKNLHFLLIFIINFICFLMFNFFYLIYENLVCFLTLLKLFLGLAPSIIKFFFISLINYIKFLFFSYSCSLWFATLYLDQDLLVLILVIIFHCRNLFSDRSFANFHKMN